MKNIWFVAFVTYIFSHTTVAHHSPMKEVQPPGRGTLPVCSTNMRVAEEFADIGDQAMHNVLLGVPRESAEPQFVVDVMAHPESTWKVIADIPQSADTYGPVSGQQIPVLVYVTYPCALDSPGETYTFPYQNGQFGVFENMLKPGAKPAIADSAESYPLLVLSHGSQAHGIYSVGHAHDLARHGYIVAVPIYGDDRNAVPESRNSHLGFMRPLLTKAVIDSIVDSEEFGNHVEANNVGISGHSFGGFTALAIGGGLIHNSQESVVDSRVKAGVLAAPWVGHPEPTEDYYPFGQNHQGLSNVETPMIWLIGTRDRATPARFALDAARKTAGATYMIELVGQPHVFEGPSWVDRNNWELLFFNAYLKDDETALELIRTGSSMAGGNTDFQLFSFQR